MRKRKDRIRNKCIFLLCLYYGFERSTIMKLTFDNIQKDKLIVEERELLIPSKLLRLLDDLKQENAQKKVKGNHLFNLKYKKQFSPISEGQVNYVFDILSGIDKDDPNWKSLNPTSIRTYLIKQLFINNYPIEEILYLTGADLTSISKILTFDEIVEHVKLRGKKVSKAHPFEKKLF